LPISHVWANSIALREKISNQSELVLFGQMVCVCVRIILIMKRNLPGTIESSSRWVLGLSEARPKAAHEGRGRCKEWAIARLSDDDAGFG
jgi:hypothetical protein